MKLFSYDHCPYCVKARMIFGFKSVPFELVTLLNDDEETPIKMIGQKMLPILEKKENSFMAESLDIISYIDSLEEFGPPIVTASHNSVVLKDWLIDCREYHYRLAMPRWPKMGIDEFKTVSAVEYFTKKKEQAIGSFEENEERSASLIIMANSHLKELESLIVGKPYFWGNELSLDDFNVFSALRCLTTTSGVEFPEKIEIYMNEISKKTNVSLHWDLSL